MEYLLIENAITQALQICMKLESERGLIAGEGEARLLNAYIKVFRLLFVFFSRCGCGRESKWNFKCTQRLCVTKEASLIVLQVQSLYQVLI